MSSRVAKKQIDLPKDVSVELNDTLLTVKGKHGQLQHNLRPGISLQIHEEQILVVTKSEKDKSLNAMAGTTRALVNNAVVGVSEKFAKKLTMKGVGYRAQVKGNTLILSVGFSHPVEFIIPEGISIETPSQTEILVSGIDKQQVGQISANIRRVRPPEPYKGKGIRYADETVIIKETKK